jgi:hypothetical protein
MYVWLFGMDIPSVSKKGRVKGVIMYLYVSAFQ